MRVPKSPPDPIDVAVGARVRVLRKARGVSQEALGSAIGLTFQQVQKYERASNRISASMLVRIAQALGTTVGELVDDEVEGAHPLGDLLGLIGKPGVLELAQAFVRIQSGKQRRVLTELARAIADDG